MNLNLIAYLLYFLLTAFIILRVGWLFYHFGAVYLYELLGKKNGLADTINRLLLLGYYLLNLGYVALSISFWPRVQNSMQLWVLLSEKIGFICMVLALIHFANLLWLRLLKKLSNTHF